MRTGAELGAGAGTAAGAGSGGSAGGTEHQKIEIGAIFRRLGLGGPLAVISLTLPIVGSALLLGLLTWLDPHLRSWGAWGVVVYILCFALFSGLAVLNTWVQAVLGGWVYKFALGFPAALAGVLGGSLIGYAIGRRATGDRLVTLLAEHPKWHAVHQALLHSGFGRTLLIVTLLRLNSPFALTNFVLAATRTNLLAYVLGTAIGLGSRTAATVFIGAGLKELTFENPSNRWLWIGTIVTVIVAVMVIGHIASQAVGRVTGSSNAAK